MTLTGVPSPPAPAPRSGSEGDAPAGPRAALLRAAGRATGVAVTATGVVGGAARALCTPTGLMGAAVEATWLATHVALYPWGLVADRRQDQAHGYSVSELPPVQRGLVIGDVEAAGTPILLVHGMADNNTGTYPIQSERMYAALKGNGGTARYVQLPAESHGYAARESIGHTLFEMMTWLDQWVKPKPRM